MVLRSPPDGQSQQEADAAADNLYKELRQDWVDEALEMFPRISADTLIYELDRSAEGSILPPADEALVMAYAHPLFKPGAGASNLDTCIV